MMKRTTRYQAAIIMDDRILLLWVTDPDDGRSFWVIPGGGIEPDETEEACVVREALEETCLDVEVERLLLDDYFPDNTFYRYRKTYLCRVVGGELRAGCEPEVDTATFSSIQGVEWFDLRVPQSWPPLLFRDGITNPLLLRIRAALGYQ